MGINDQNNILWKSAKVDFDTIIYFLEQHHLLRQRNNHTTRLHPTVSFDVSLLGYLFIGKPSLCPARAVAVIAECFVSRAVNVILDADGPTRHHSKRAHQDRVAQKDRIRIQLMENRANLAQLINHPNPSKAIVAQKEKLMKEIRRKEPQQQRGLPPDFIDKIDEFVKSFQSNTTGCTIKLRKSLWQADPAIAKRAIDGSIDAILSGDSDFAMYVGNGGPDGHGDIMLRNPKLVTKRRNIQLESFEIWTGQKTVVEYISKTIQPKVQHPIFQKQPRYPIFNGLDRIRTRALFALALGCDKRP